MLSFGSSVSLRAIRLCASRVVAAHGSRGAAVVRCVGLRLFFTSAFSPYSGVSLSGGVNGRHPRSYVAGHHIT